MDGGGLPPILPGAAPHGLWPRPERGGTPGRALSQALGAQDNVLASCSFPQSVLIWKYIPDYPEESCIVHRTSRIWSACLPGRDAHPSETPMTTSDEWAAFGSRLTLHQESQTPLSLCLFSSWGGGLASSWGHPVCAGQPWLLDFKSYKKRGAFLHSLACVLSRSAVSDSLQPHGLQPTRVLCPWNSLGKNTGVVCHSLLQGPSRPKDLTQVSCISGGFFTV